MVNEKRLRIAILWDECQQFQYYENENTKLFVQNLYLHNTHIINT